MSTSTRELATTAEALRDQLNPIKAVTEVLQQVDAGRAELARLAREGEEVNELLRSGPIPTPFLILVLLLVFVLDHPVHVLKSAAVLLLRKQQRRS